MLILTRRIGESIIIGDNISLTVSGIKGDLVRITSATPKLLLVTKKVTQSITIGHDITVTILSIKGMQVRLGIDAPRSVSIHREEIYQRIQDEKTQDLPLYALQKSRISSAALNR